MADGSDARGDTATEESPAQGASDAPKKDALIVEGEKAIDVTLGVAVIAAEAITRAAKLLQENGPAYLDMLETKGRPVRERIAEALRGGRTATLRDVAFTPPATADEEISALERRVRELEQQIASGGSAETPAEEATFVPQDSWGESVHSLAESPYAISETEEERAQEEKSDREPGKGDGP